MKFLLILIAVILPLAAESAKKPATKKAAAAKKAPAQQNPVPKGAKKISDTEWRYVDKDGKAWIYRKNPFGIAKLPEEKVKGDAILADAPQHATGAPLEIRDLGNDTFEFSRRTPFGVSKWTKKKSEMNTDEKAAFDSFQAVKLK